MSSIYEINQSILDCIDSETGEIINQEKLEELQLERDNKIESVALWIKDLRLQIAGLKTEEKNLAERRKSKERLADNLENYLAQVLNCHKFETAKCVISWRKSQAVSIIDEGAIPAEYKTIETLSKVDKNAIKNAIKMGELIDGAELIENISMQLK